MLSLAPCFLSRIIFHFPLLPFVNLVILLLSWSAWSGSCMYLFVEVWDSEWVLLLSNLLLVDVCTQGVCENALKINICVVLAWVLSSSVILVVYESMRRSYGHVIFFVCKRGWYVLCHCECGMLTLFWMSSSLISMSPYLYANRITLSCDLPL
jgi:ATP/ADP translocase